MKPIDMTPAWDKNGGSNKQVCVENTWITNLFNTGKLYKLCVKGINKIQWLEIYA